MKTLPELNARLRYTGPTITTSGGTIEPGDVGAVTERHPEPEESAPLGWALLTFANGATRALRPHADGSRCRDYELVVSPSGRAAVRQPPVQNIPLRTELGKQILRAFKGKRQ